MDVRKKPSPEATRRNRQRQEHTPCGVLEQELGQRHLKDEARLAAIRRFHFDSSCRERLRLANDGREGRETRMHTRPDDENGIAFVLDSS